MDLFDAYVGVPARRRSRPTLAPSRASPAAVALGQLRAAARAAGGDPREQLVGMFDALVTACRRQGYHGCAFINTAAEVDADTDVHARTVEHKTVVRAWVTDLAQRAGAQDPELLARHLTLLIDGGLASGVLDADLSAAEAAKQAARALIDIACP